MKILQRFRKWIKYKREIRKYWTITPGGTVIVDPAWYGTNKKLTERLKAAAYRRTELIRKYGAKGHKVHIDL
jgi:hypothetical protein